MDWDEMARPWLEAAPDLEAAFDEIFAALFEAARLTPGQRVLDVGCGTGPTLLKAAKAVGPTGRILGLDIAPPLVAAATKRVPETVTVATGDAATYPYDDGTFDTVISNFGIMFFDDSLAAFRTLRLAVRKGGRLAATVWGAPGDNPWFAIPRSIVDRHLADVPRPDPAGPGPMRFADATTLTELLTDAGWDATVQSVDVHLRPPGPVARVAALHMLVTVGMMIRGMEVSDTVQARIAADLKTAFAGFETDGVFRVPARIHVVSAVAAAT